MQNVSKLIKEVLNDSRFIGSGIVNIEEKHHERTDAQGVIFCVSVQILRRKNKEGEMEPIYRADAESRSRFFQDEVEDLYRRLFYAMMEKSLSLGVNNSVAERSVATEAK